MEDNIKERVKLIPAVAQVLVEYEQWYRKEKAREMFDILVEQIQNFYENEYLRNGIFRLIG